MYTKFVKEELLKGAELLADVVSSTLGPKGRNVIVNRLSDNPIITKDGVTVAKNVHLKSTVQNIAVRLIKEASMNVVKEAGDGTTTATLLTKEFFKMGSQLIENGDYTPNEIKEAFELYKDDVLAQLEKTKINIDTNNTDLLKKIAIVSANNDAFLGGVIYDALEQVEFSGTVKVLPSTNSETGTEKVDGVEYRNGYISPYFVNNPENRKAEYFSEVAVYLFDKKLESPSEIEAILKRNYESPVMFICADYSAEAMSMLVINKQRGRKIVAVRAAEFGDYRKAVFEDLHFMTGAEVITALTPFNNESANKYRGIVDGCIVTKSAHTLFLNQNTFVTEETNKHVQTLKALLGNTSIEFDRIKISDRISKLTTGIVNIYVGARTELELGEKVDRVDDALLATQAAYAEGIVVGSGLALPKAFVKIAHKKRDEPGYSDMRLVNAFDAVIRSCFYKICENAYITDVDRIIKGVVEQNSDDFLGYNILNFNKYDKNPIPVDLLKLGIIDPFKVTRSALENALSIAMMLLSVDNIVEHFDLDNPYLPEINGH